MLLAKLYPESDVFDESNVSFEQIFSKTRHGRHKDVESMLDAGAPVDGQDPYGNTVLHTACQNGNKRIVKACLRRGCDTNAQNIRCISFAEKGQDQKKRKG